MALVRLRVACRGHVELHEALGPEVEIGRDALCDLSIDHASVASRHARLLVRRNRLILTDLGIAKTGTSRSGDRLLAPVALIDGEPFLLGDVEIAATLVSERERGLVGRVLDEGQVSGELASSDPHLRRYVVVDRDGARRELAHAEPTVDRRLLDPWSSRMQASSALYPHLAPLLAQCEIDGRPGVIEAVPPGVRLTRLIEAIDAGVVGVPVEALIVILAHLADAVAAIGAAIGAHGAIDPSAVQLGIDGSITLLRPGPSPDARSLDDALVAPERRLFFEATAAGDAFALGKIGSLLLGLAGGCPPRLRAICAWLAHVDPRRRPQDLRTLAEELRSAAMRDGLDPTYGHVARAVRAFAPGRARPLAKVSARGLR